jgi:TatD DNase family protein
MNLPPLDCHAHISVGVTDRQLAALNPSIVFAMTRSPDEAFEATQRYDRNVLWACGAHPAYIATGGEFEIETFARRAKRFALIGEVGLDRRSGNLERQRDVFDSILRFAIDQPVLVSVHSAGCSVDVVKSIERLGEVPQGLIMHWFSGSTEEAKRLVRLGSYFSVNTAMRDEVLAVLPLERLLPETDFPVARKKTGAQPGDTGALESKIGALAGLSPEQVRSQFYKNLRRIAMGSGAIDRMPSHLVEMLLLAT